jgi:hypothetical protein
MNEDSTIESTKKVIINIYFENDTINCKIDLNNIDIEFTFFEYHFLQQLLNPAYVKVLSPEEVIDHSDMVIEMSEEYCLQLIQNYLTDYKK